MVNERLRACCLVAALAFALPPLALADPIQPDQIRVIDGDIIRVFHRKPDVRLVGFDAPEAMITILQVIVQV